MKWQSTLVLCLVGIGLLVGAYFYGHYQGVRSAVHAPADTSSTVTPTPVVPPPVEVKPNPAPAKPRPDLTQTKIADSLILVIQNKDSLLASLLTTQYVEQNYSTRADSVTVVGRLEVLYYPLNREFVTDVHIDSLVVPDRVITIIRTIETETFNWHALSAALAGGIAIGMWIGYGQ